MCFRLWEIEMRLRNKCSPEHSKWKIHYPAKFLVCSIVMPATNPVSLLKSFPTAFPPLSFSFLAQSLPTLCNLNSMFNRCTQVAMKLRKMSQFTRIKRYIQDVSFQYVFVPLPLKFSSSKKKNQQLVMG